jgi:hypothetical protein
MCDWEGLLSSNYAFGQNGVGHLRSEIPYKETEITGLHRREHEKFGSRIKISVTLWKALS